MYRKYSKYIMEMLIMFGVLFAVFGALISLELLKVEIKLHIYTISVAVILLVGIYNYSNVINIGIKAIVDLVFRLKTQRIVCVLQIINYEASTFSDKWSKDYTLIPEKRFLLFVDSGEGVECLLCSDTCDLKAGERYVCTFGRFSKIILECKAADCSMS